MLHSFVSMKTWTRRATILLTFLVLFLSLSVTQFIVALYANSFMLMCDSTVMFVDCITFKVNLNAELGWSENSMRDQVNASGFSLFALILLTTATSVLTMFRIHHNFTENYVNTDAMLGFGIVGLLFDGISFATFHCIHEEESKASETLNMSSAWLHVLSDTLRSVATISVGLFLTEDTDLSGNTDVKIDSYAALCANGLVLLSCIPAVFDWYAQHQALRKGDYVSIVTEEEDEVQIE